MAPGVHRRGSVARTRGSKAERGRAAPPRLPPPPLSEANRIAFFNLLGLESTRGPSWGHILVVLGAILSFLEPFCGHLLTKLISFLVNGRLKYPHEGPCV